MVSRSGKCAKKAGCSGDRPRRVGDGGMMLRRRSLVLHRRRAGPIGPRIGNRSGYLAVRGGERVADRRAAAKNERRASFSVAQTAARPSDHRRRRDVQHRLGTRPIDRETTRARCLRRGVPRTGPTPRGSDSNHRRSSTRHRRSSRYRRRDGGMSSVRPTRVSDRGSGVTGHRRSNTHRPPTIVAVGFISFNSSVVTASGS